MPYILQGTMTLLSYWNTLGRPCDLQTLANATKINKINFVAGGRDARSETFKYGEVEAQNLASVLGVTVANVTTNGGQVLI